MKLIVLSSSGKKEGEPQLITNLFEAGLQTLHLRKPKFSTNQLRKFIQQIPVEYHNRIVIHSHHNLAARFKLKGIHITKVHRRNKVKTWLVTKWLKFKKPELIVTSSFSSLSGVLENAEKYNYVFLSPVFDSLTHKYQSGYSEHSLKSAIQRSPHKIIARSGIDIPVIPKIKELGFEGMAIYSALWKKPDPVVAFRQFLEACTEHQISVE